MEKKYNLCEPCFFSYRKKNGRHLYIKEMNLNGKKKRLYALKIGGITTISLDERDYYNADFRVSGETDFNFNDKKLKKFYEIIDKDSKYCVDDKNDLKELLLSASKLHHTLLNFSLMQTMGNLQGFKGKDALDRFDRFIYSLSEYYNENSKIINKFKDNSGDTNWSYLKKYLDLFGDGKIGFNNYFSNVYFAGITNSDNIDIMEKLIESGKEPIDSAERVNEYVKLANEFWDIRDDCYRSFIEQKITV